MELIHITTTAAIQGQRPTLLAILQVLQLDILHPTQGILQLPIRLLQGIRLTRLIQPDILLPIRLLQGIQPTHLTPALHLSRAQPTRPRRLRPRLPTSPVTHPEPKHRLDLRHQPSPAILHQTTKEADLGEATLACLPSLL
jgi:hypothetical protein